MFRFWLPPVPTRFGTRSESAAKHRARQTFIDFSKQSSRGSETVRSGGIVIASALEKSMNVIDVEAILEQQNHSDESDRHRVKLQASSYPVNGVIFAV